MFIIRVSYNVTANAHGDMPGVEVRVLDFGKTRTVGNLATGDIPILTAPYMNRLINFFVSQGYIKGETLRSAPYDWRLSAGV